MKKGFSFDSAYKPTPNYILTPKEFSEKQKDKNIDVISMNDITATRTPRVVSGNKNLLLLYFELTKQIMKEEEYKRQYEQRYLDDFVKFFRVLSNFTDQFQRKNTLLEKFRYRRLKNIDEIKETEIKKSDLFDVKTSFCRIPTWAFDILSIKYNIGYKDFLESNDTSTVCYIKKMKEKGLISSYLADKFMLLEEFAYQLRMEVHFLRLKEDDKVFLNEMSDVGLQKLKYFSRVMVNPIKEAFENLVLTYNDEQNLLSESISSFHTNKAKKLPKFPSLDVNGENNQKIEYLLFVDLFAMIQEEEFYLRMENVCEEVNLKNPCMIECLKFDSPT